MNSIDGVKAFVPTDEGTTRRGQGNDDRMNAVGIAALNFKQREW